jgi:hypothetical protein
MPYIVVEHFKGGLDTRRSDLVSSPGTMIKAQNVHISRGGELEKRKAFKTYSSVPGTFGMEATGDGIVVFAPASYEYPIYQDCIMTASPYVDFPTSGPPPSENDPGLNWGPANPSGPGLPGSLGSMQGSGGNCGFPTETSNGEYVSFPGEGPGWTLRKRYSYEARDLGDGIWHATRTFRSYYTIVNGVTVQKLVHPDGYQLTGIVSSTVYGGKAFAIGKFSNGDVLPFLDGNLIGAFIDGKIRNTMGNLDGFALNMRMLIQKTIDEAKAKFASNPDWNDPIKDYTVSNSGSSVIITGPGSVDYSTSTNNGASDLTPVTMTTTVTQKQTKPIGTVGAQGGFTVLSGADGSGKMTIRFSGRFNRPDVLNPSFPGITGIYVKASGPTTGDGFDALLYSPSGGSWLKYDTVPPDRSISVWDPNQMLLNSIATVMNAATNTTGIKAQYNFEGYYNGGWDKCSLDILTTPEVAEEFHKTYVQVEFETNPSGFGGLDEFITGPIVPSPYHSGRYIAQAHTMTYTLSTTGTPTWYQEETSGTFIGRNNSIYSIKVGTTELMVTPQFYYESNEDLARRVVEEINRNTDAGLTHHYTAERTGAKVTITALASTGASENGKEVIVYSKGDVRVYGRFNMGGGVDGVPGQSKITQFTFGGTFTEGKEAWILVTDPTRPGQPYKFGATRVTGKQPSFCFTYKGKEYVGVGSAIFFSALNDAGKWDLYDTGSGFIDMANNFGGRENVTGAGVYQNTVAVFTERNCQLWFLDPDPNLNSQHQVLDNTGCIAPDTVISVGSIDLFYLSYNGVRSLKARDNTDAAYANDIGSPIDDVIVKHLDTLSDDTRYSSKAIIEPQDGRYWISIGGRLFVLSCFQGSGISAWTEYVTGFSVTDMVVRRNRVYVRSGDTVYLYGGTTGVEYDNCHVDVELPYLDANKPGTFKSVNGIDMTCEGEWLVSLGFDYTNPTAKDEIATFTQPSFALGKIPATGIGTHIGVKFTSDYNGYCRIANLLVHYDDLHSKHEAG